MPKLTPAERRAAILALEGIAQIVAAAGPLGAPAGHVYAACMPAGISLEAFQGAVALLKGAGLVTERAHLLTWTGSAVERSADAEHGEDDPYYYKDR